MIINLIDNPDAFRPPQLNENYPLDVNTSYIDGHTSASASFEVLFKKNIDNAHYDKYSYQWYKDGNVIDDATDKTLHINDISEECNHSISCRVVNKAGREAESRLAALNVERFYLPVLDEAYPASITKALSIDGKATGIFEVKILEHGNPSNGYEYRWYVDGEVQSEGVTVTESGSTFTIMYTEAKIVSIYCEVYLNGEAACSTSSVAIYTVTEPTETEYKWTDSTGMRWCNNGGEYQASSVGCQYDYDNGTRIYNFVQEIKFTTGSTGGSEYDFTWTPAQLFNGSADTMSCMITASMLEYPDISTGGTVMSRSGYEHTLSGKYDFLPNTNYYIYIYAGNAVTHTSEYRYGVGSSGNDLNTWGTTSITIRNYGDG